MRDTAALRTARLLETDPYRRQFAFPKWNRYVTVTDEHSLFARLPEFDGWTSAQHEAIARQYAVLSAAERGMWLQLVTIGARTFGDGNGVLISGVYREHWPDRLKHDLRTLAHSEGEYSARSFAHWQAAGKRLATWREMVDAIEVTR